MTVHEISPTSTWIPSLPRLIFTCHDVSDSGLPEGPNRVTQRTDEHRRNIETR